MKPDLGRPLTWILSMVAIGLLAVACLRPGPGIELLPADPGLAPPLPGPAVSTTSRTGSFAQYAHVSARPLFSPDRRLHPFLLDTRASEAEGAASLDYMLTGVLSTPELQLAIIRREPTSESVRIRLGEETPDGWRLIELHPRSAVFAGAGGTATLVLQSFDGSGGYTQGIATIPVLAGSEAMAGPQVETDPQIHETSLRDRIEARRAALRAEAALGN